MNPTYVDFAEKLISVGVGAIGTLIAVGNLYDKKHRETLQRYADGQQKAYAAERDFNHLRRNQESISQAIGILEEELKETREDFLEIKGMLMVALSQLGVTESSVLAHRKKD